MPEEFPDGRHLLPDGAMINAEVHVFQYLDPGTGDVDWSLRVRGEVPVSQIIGLLTIAILDLWKTNGYPESESRDMNN